MKTPKVEITGADIRRLNQNLENLDKTMTTAISVLRDIAACHLVEAQYLFAAAGALIASPSYPLDQREVWTAFMAGAANTLNRFAPDAK